MNEKDKFIVTDKEGRKISMYTIATYTDDTTNKNYIVYTDGKLNNEKKLNVYYAMYNNINNKIKLISIEKSEDKKIALEIVKSILEDIK